jgi:recombination protein RecA
VAKKKEKNRPAKVENKEEVSLELVRKAIKKKYGEVISVLADHGDMVIPTISTGCLSLDLALGCGGMGMGRIYEIFGPAGGGKSTMAVNVIIQAQRRGLRCLYIDAEHALDPHLLKKYGVDTQSLEVAQAYDGEGNLDILERYVKMGIFRVVVVDSVSALIPRDEAEGDIEDITIGKHAKLMSKALRRVVPIANETNTLIIFINQFRMKIGKYGNPETTTGGEALPFYATGRISVRGPEAKSRRIEDKATGEVIGHKAVFQIEKNKLAAPFKKAEVDLIYGEGYDFTGEILKVASSIGVVEKTGAWYKYNDENIANGEDNAKVFLKENPDIFKEIREEVMITTGLKEEYECHGHEGPIYT